MAVGFRRLHLLIQSGLVNLIDTFIIAPARHHVKLALLFYLLFINQHNGNKRQHKADNTAIYAAYRKKADGEEYVNHGSSPFPLADLAPIGHA